jgi:hypothetical protein
MSAPAYTDLTGLAGIALALAATPLIFPGIRRWPRPRLALLLAATAVAVLVPCGTLPLAAFVRGATGDLSVTTLVIFAGIIFRALSGRPMLEDRAPLALPMAISVAALGFYPLALGVGLFDPYRLGYGSPWLLAALFAAALAAWFARLARLAACLALATLAWAANAYESTNVWDYLLDPLVSFYALGTITVGGVKRLLRSRRSSPRDATPVDSVKPS